MTINTILSFYGLPTLSRFCTVLDLKNFLHTGSSGDARQKRMVVPITEYQALKLHSKMPVKKYNVYVDSKDPFI